MPGVEVVAEVPKVAIAIGRRDNAREEAGLRHPRLFALGLLEVDADVRAEAIVGVALRGMSRVRRKAGLPAARDDSAELLSMVGQL